MKLQKYKFTWMLAKRDILEEKKISIIVIAMLSFSFLNLAFFPAFINGLNFLFTSNIIETQSGHVLIEADEGRLENPDALTRQIRGLDHVESVEKRLTFQGRLSHQGTTITRQIIATDNLDDEIYGSRLDSGRLFSPRQQGNILLGLFLAQDDQLGGNDGLDVREGRQITLQAGTGQKKMDVTGIIGRPGPGSVVEQAFIPYQDAEELLDAEGEATSIKILLDDRERSDEFKQRLKTLNTRGVIQTWLEVSDISEGIDSTFSIVTGVVSVVGIIIALTSIGVVIFINSSKRKREMGIVRSIGTESTQIMQIFITEAMVFGIAGTLAGIAIMVGIHTYLAANPLSTPLGPLSTRISAELLLSRAAWMLIAAFIAGFIPAYLVSKLSIIDSIEGR